MRGDWSTERGDEIESSGRREYAHMLHGTVPKIGGQGAGGGVL